MQRGVFTNLVSIVKAAAFCAHPTTIVRSYVPHVAYIPDVRPGSRISTPTKWVVGRVSRKTPCKVCDDVGTFDATQTTKSHR